MKKTAAAVLAVCMLLPVGAGAVETQYSTQELINNAFTWLETNAQPMSAAGASSSDYYIMALARMGRDYPYSSYVEATSRITPSTPQDAQRLIMSNAACGEVLSNSFVGAYTYNAQLDTASDIAGAIITLRGCGYEVVSDTESIENMTGRLLTMQQSNGSFGNDVLSTARSVIALSWSSGSEYILKGTADTEEYTYSVDSALENALSYLSSNQASDGGFGTISATAYTVIALDSIDVDAQNDYRFIKNGVSPFEYIAAHALADGSFSSSADDTAMAVCALVSHLRAMQGKAAFFAINSGDEVDTVRSDSESANSSSTPSSAGASGSASSATQQPAQSTPGSITVTPPPTRSPEHSAMESEEYGPQQFVGPVRSTDEPRNGGDAGTSDSASGAGTVILIVVCCIAALLIIAAGALYFLKPELFKKLLGKAKALSKPSKPAADEDKKEPEHDLLDEIDKTPEVVPTEELYDPDFIKRLIPVDELDTSIDALLPKEDGETDGKTDEKSDGEAPV